MAYKDFQAAQVLTAQEVDTYLMNQSVIVFEDALERSTTLTAPTEGMVTYLKDTNLTQVYDGSIWVDILNSIPTSNRNLLINGSFDVWQRSTVGTCANANNYFGADRWRQQTVSSGGSFSIIRSTDPTYAIPETRYYATLSRSNGNSNTGLLRVGQILESADSAHTRGQYVTLSFYASKRPAFSPVNGAVAVRVRSGTGTDQTWFAFTNETDVINTTVNLTTTMQRYSFTGLVPTNCNQLYLVFEWAPTGTAGLVTDAWQLAGVQLELGRQATPLERLQYAEILSRCERYYQVHSQPAMRGVTANAFGRMGYALTTTMRANASLASNGGTMGFYNGGLAAIGNVNFNVVFNFSPSSVEADIVSSGWGTGNAAIFYKGAGQTFAITCDAEL